MASQFKDKVAIVTGSSSGIGEAIAILLASKGANVTLCGRDQDRLKLVFGKIAKVNGGDLDKVHVVQGDVNDRIIRKQIVDETVQKFHCLDILITNAGVCGANESVVTATEESYDKVFNTNIKSVFFLIQQAVPHLEKTKGNIVSISSIITSIVVPSAGIYSMSKIALDHLTRCLAVDLGPKSIRVNSVKSSFIATNIGRDYGDKFDDMAIVFAKLEADKRALKYRALTVDDIAQAVVFLASDAAGFITGDIITVDGGRVFGGSIDFSSLNLQ